jgi:hypothetical protein
MKTILMQKKAMIAAGIIAIVLLLGAGAYVYLKTPVNLLAIDVNPSIELRTNRLNQVVSIDPVNGDAADLMAGYQLEDRDLENVIEDIVDRMIFFGYLTADQQNQILITADDTYNSTDLLNTVNSAIADYMAQRQLEVEVFRQQLSVNSTQEDAAHANNVSFGKMSIINELTANGVNLTTEELAGSSVRQLIEYAVAQGISLEDLIDNYNDIIKEQLKDTAAATDISDVDAAKDENEDVIQEGIDGNAASVEDTSEEDDASIEDAEEADLDSNEDADEDVKTYKASKEDADQGEDYDDTENEDEDTYEASDENNGSQGEDQKYEDASDEGENDEDAFEEADDNESGSSHEDSYYEDSENEDSSEIEEDGNSYYEEDQDDNSQGDEDSNRSGDNDNRQGDENEDD